MIVEQNLPQPLIGYNVIEAIAYEKSGVTEPALKSGFQQLSSEEVSSLNEILQESKTKQLAKVTIQKGGLTNRQVE